MSLMGCLFAEVMFPVVQKAVVRHAGKELGEAAKVVGVGPLGDCVLGDLPCPGV